MEGIKSFLRNAYFLGACRIVMGALFLLASTGKILFPHDFAGNIYAFMLMPAFLVPAFAAILPWIEFAAGLLLLADIKPKSAALIIMGLLVVFMGAMLWSIAQGLDIVCGCFDILFPDTRVGWATIARNIAMMLIIAPVLFLDHNEIRLYGLLKK